MLKGINWLTIESLIVDVSHFDQSPNATKKENSGRSRDGDFDHEP